MIVRLSDRRLRFERNLNGENSAPIAEKLRTNGIPVVLVTGYVATALTDPVLRTAPCVAKPFTDKELIRVMTEQFCRCR
jgi:hypothetical protein